MRNTALPFGVWAFARWSSVCAGWPAGAPNLSGQRRFPGNGTDFCRTDEFVPVNSELFTYNAVVRNGKPFADRNQVH